MNYKKLSDVAYYSELRTRDITIENYITTDNMLPNIGGICTASSIPDCKTARYYEEGDILLSNIRPYFCKIWYANRCGSASNDVLVIKNKEDIDSKFLYYILCDKNFFNYDTVTSKGTKMPRGTPNAIMKYLVPDVDDKVQKKIASVLSAYDDLIEKNNRKIEILQDMAEELYKEWFVRFRFPGYKTVKFTDGIPDGWEVKRMNDFCYVTDGTHDTPKPQLEGIPLVTGKCIDNGFIDFSQSYPISIKDHESIKVRSGLKSGDILFSNIGTVGTTCMVDYTREFSVKNVIIFKPESKIEGNYLYYWLNSNAIQETFSNQTNGASQQFVGLTFMRKFKILVPTKDVLEQFSNKVDSIVQARRNLHNINENLKTQRDLLLPRLMSGKLAVKVS